MIANDNHTETCDYCKRRVEHCEELPPINSSFDIETMLLICEECRGKYEENWTAHQDNIAMKSGSYDEV